jgi:hypothetical protein
VIPHFGWLLRSADARRPVPERLPDTSSSNLDALRGSEIKTVFRRAMDVGGAHRLLFGTDSSFFPRGWNEMSEGDTCLSRSRRRSTDARMMLEGNLVRLSPTIIDFQCFGGAGMASAGSRKSEAVPFRLRGLTAVSRFGVAFWLTLTPSNAQQTTPPSSQ